MTTVPEGPASDTAARGLTAGLPGDPEDGGDVDVLYLTGRRPAAAGEWLLITAAGGLPRRGLSPRPDPAPRRLRPMAVTSWSTWLPGRRPGRWICPRSGPGRGRSSTGC